MLELCCEPHLDHFEIHGADFFTRVHDAVFGITAEFEAFLFSCCSDNDRNFQIVLLYSEPQFEKTWNCFRWFFLETLIMFVPRPSLIV